MIKTTLYPKTTRVPVNSDCICELTEKLDGSNLCIFKKDNIVHIAQRNNIYTVDEIINSDKRTVSLYKGLKQWVIEHKDYLQEQLYDKSVLCGEWLGMGALKYLDKPEFTNRFYMFAKANITEDFTLINKTHYHSLFIYPFKDMKIPDFISLVPTVKICSAIPTKEELDIIYEEYTSKVGRNVEGIVVNYQNNISKYVRMKSGKMQEHTDRY